MWLFRCVCVCVYRCIDPAIQIDWMWFLFNATFVWHDSWLLHDYCGFSVQAIHFMWLCINARITSIKNSSDTHWFLMRHRLFIEMWFFFMYKTSNITAFLFTYLIEFFRNALKFIKPQRKNEKTWAIFNESDEPFNTTVADFCFSCKTLNTIITLTLLNKIYS